jgi:hypothetical protein
MHARRHDNEVQPLGFELLELDGDDLRRTEEHSPL